MLESDVAEETDEKEEEEHDIAGLGPGPVDYAESVEWARVQQKALQQFDSVNGTELYPRLCERIRPRCSCSWRKPPCSRSPHRC